MEHHERDHERAPGEEGRVREQRAPAASEAIHDAGMVASSSESGGDYDAQGATAGSLDEPMTPEERSDEASGAAEGPAQTQESPNR